uniref:MFS domain-containing protein n=1 Tax=Rhabditophanes sp. KR3021 TaxID=114890 RepID=A0AC35TVY0_9BILA
MVEWNFIRFLLICCAIAFSCNFAYGFGTVYVNSPVLQFKNFLNESLAKRGQNMTEESYNFIWNWISNVWFIGFFIGIVINPMICDRYGRKVAFVAGNVLSFAGSVLRVVCILTYTPELLIAGRVFVSVATGITYQAQILYLQEISPTELRGIAGFISEISFAISTLIGMFLGMSNILGDHLLWYLIVPIIPTFAAIIAIIPIHETPKFLLIVKKDVKKCIESIKFFHGKVDVENVMHEIQKECSEEKEDTASLLVLAREFVSNRHLIKSFILYAAALQNTVALWSILLSSTTFLLRVNLEIELAQATSTVMTVFYVIGTISGSMIVEKTGRYLLLSATTVNVFTLVLFSIFQIINPTFPFSKYLCLVSLCIFSLSYGFSVGPESWSMCVNLIRHRAFTQFLAYGFNTIMVVITSFSIMPMYNSSLGAYSFIILYVIPSIFSLIILFLYLPETKGREMHDVVAEIKRTKWFKIF